MSTQLEEMSTFFDKRATSYDDHMIVDLNLGEYYDQFGAQITPSSKPLRFLDLGCGTGLEIEKVFGLCPNAQVTAVDLSSGMLTVLKERFIAKASQLEVICASYFELEFGVECFDYVISSYSLHHFPHDAMLSLIKKVCDSLKPDGIFIDGDYVVPTLELEAFYMSEAARLRAEAGNTHEFYHYDTPFTVATTIRLLKAAGFANITTPCLWDSTCIFVANKHQYIK